MDTTCDICGSPDVQHSKCKVICRHCGTILQSCADLAAGDDLNAAPRAATPLRR